MNEFEEMARSYVPPVGMLCRDRAVVEAESGTIKDHLAGRSQAEISARRKIPVSTVAKIVERIKREGGDTYRARIPRGS